MAADGQSLLHAFVDDVFKEAVSRSEASEFLKSQECGTGYYAAVISNYANSATSHAQHNPVACDIA